MNYYIKATIRSNTGLMLVLTSVTGLGDFWKFKMAYCDAKVAQMIGYFLGFLKTSF